MKDWRGSSKSTSEFVAHFIASGTNNGTGYVTVEEAILSVLPRDIDSQGEFVKQQTEDLLRIDNDSIYNHLDAEFRHDPRHFDLHRQLRPVELLALGSIWYLPGDAPKDPGKMMMSHCFFYLVDATYIHHPKPMYDCDANAMLHVVV
jgi:hypothetical protein